MTYDLGSGLDERFRDAVAAVDGVYGEDVRRLEDWNTDAQLRDWLDRRDEPLPWTDPSGSVTPDEWFFITTLYGTMTLDGQRSHIRRFFSPLLVAAARRDMRNFFPGMSEYAGLRSEWMSERLCRMGTVLRERGMTLRTCRQQTHDPTALFIGLQRAASASIAPFRLLPSAAGQ